MGMDGKPQEVVVKKTDTPSVEKTDEAKTTTTDLVQMHLLLQHR